MGGGVEDGMGIRVQGTGTYITSKKQKGGKAPLHLIELILARSTTPYLVGLDSSFCD